MHFLVDTSRNGWLTSESNEYTAVDPDTHKHSYYSRKDQRHHRGNWCNIQDVQPTATKYDNEAKRLLPSKATSPGLGLLPQIPKGSHALFNPLYQDANGQSIPLPIDAYVWIKPPGESDGYYKANKKEGDEMCGNADGADHNDHESTDSLQNKFKHAPYAGEFFDQAFKNLIDVRGCIDNKFTSSFCN
jgi:cellulose 1,4-beta-cellobiosidase